MAGEARDATSRRASMAALCQGHRYCAIARAARRDGTRRRSATVAGGRRTCVNGGSVRAAGGLVPWRARACVRARSLRHSGPRGGAQAEQWCGHAGRERLGAAGRKRAGSGAQASGTGRRSGAGRVEREGAERAGRREREREGEEKEKKKMGKRKRKRKGRERNKEREGASASALIAAAVGHARCRPRATRRPRAKQGDGTAEDLDIGSVPQVSEDQAGDDSRRGSSSTTKQNFSA